MIDIEAVVFDKVREAVKTKYPKAFVESMYVDKSAGFPCISFVEADNSIYTKTQDLTNKENHNSLLYECNIYTDGNGRKQTSKKIANIIDDVMLKMGFNRTLFSQTPNIDRAIYRITMRYTGVVAQSVEIDGKQIYQIYKK